MPPTTTSATPPTAPAYRHDLDGLRGVAITLVAIFHIWFGKVSGGVDVFLTLSGYFFIGSLARFMTGAATRSVWATVNPGQRLQRLVRRLLPAMIVVLAAVTLLTWQLMPSTRWFGIGKEIFASGTYWQNWYLAINSQDYTAASASNSPLQHLWSMSVQGQFFVGTLLLSLGLAGALALLGRLATAIWGARGGVISDPRTIRWCYATVLAVVAALSLVWAMHHSGADQMFNYYDTRSRLWEPLVGGLLAVWMPRLRLPNWLRSLGGLAALGLIISVGWWLNGVMEYPAAKAWYPVGATLIIIVLGAPDRRTGPSTFATALASKPFTWLGGISYSLYLWHWPLLIFYLEWRDKNEVSVVEGGALIVLSLALAWATTKWVETPLRAGRGRTARSPGRGGQAARRVRWYPTAVTALLLVAVLGMGAAAGYWRHRENSLVVDTAALDPARYPGARAFFEDLTVPAAPPQPSPAVVEKDLPATSYDGKISNFPDAAIHVGTYGDPRGTRTIALAGGSHAEYWITALDALGKKYHFTVKTYLKMGCPLTTNPRPPKPDGTFYPECPGWVDRVMATILADKPDAVVTNSTRPTADYRSDETPADYLGIFDRFDHAGIPVLGIRDTVWPYKIRRGLLQRDCLAEGGNGDSCGVANVLSRVDPFTQFLPRWRNVHALDLTAGMCTPTFCPAVVGNVVVFHDWHHLSATFVRSMVPELERQLGAALPWTVLR